MKYSDETITGATTTPRLKFSVRALVFLVMTIALCTWFPLLNQTFSTLAVEELFESEIQLLPQSSPVGDENKDPGDVGLSLVVADNVTVKGGIMTRSPPSSNDSDLRYSKKASYSEQNQTQDYQDSNNPSKDFDNTGFSACVLTMDDNLLWPEWVAFHYQTLPLRRLIVALDPKSKTKPTELFDRYRERGLPLNVTVWENDEFLNDKLRRKLQHNANMTSQKILRTYLSRQNMFYHKCLHQLYKEERSWVLLIDTDEYLIPQWRSLMLPPDNNETRKEPLTVYSIVTSDSSNVFSLADDPNNAQWLDSIAKGCFIFFRKRFVSGANESTESISAGLPVYLRTVQQYQYSQQSNPKVMLDLSTLEQSQARDIFSSSVGSTMNPHFGIKPMCKPVHTKALSTRPFTVAHYGAPLSVLRGRKTDPRYEYKIQQWHSESKNAKRIYNHTEFPFAKAWVHGFVKSVTKDVAIELLSPIAE